MKPEDVAGEKVLSPDLTFPIVTETLTTDSAKNLTSKPITPDLMDLTIQCTLTSLKISTLETMEEL